MPSLASLARSPVPWDPITCALGRPQSGCRPAFRSHKWAPASYRLTRQYIWVFPRLEVGQPGTTCSYSSEIFMIYLPIEKVLSTVCDEAEGEEGGSSANQPNLDRKTQQ